MPAERIASGALILDRCHAIPLATSHSARVPASVLDAAIVIQCGGGEAGHRAGTSHTPPAHLLL